MTEEPTTAYCVKYALTEGIVQVWGWEKRIADRKYFVVRYKPETSFALCLTPGEYSTDRECAVRMANEKIDEHVECLKEDIVRIRVQLARYASKRFTVDDIKETSGPVHRKG